MSQKMGHCKFQCPKKWEIINFNVIFFGTYKFNRSLVIFYFSAGVVYLLNNFIKSQSLLYKLLKNKLPQQKSKNF